MRHLISISAVLLLTGCSGAFNEYPAMKPLPDKLTCKQIEAEAENTHASLKDVQFKRSAVTSNDIAGFIVDSGYSNMLMGQQAEKARVDRMRTLMRMADQQRCTITQVSVD